MKSRNRKSPKASHWWRQFKYGSDFDIDRKEDLEIRARQSYIDAVSLVHAMRTSI